MVSASAFAVSRPYGGDIIDEHTSSRIGAGTQHSFDASSLQYLESETGSIRGNVRP